MASFKLKLKALPFDTQVFNYHLDGDFFNSVEQTEVRSSSVDVTLSVTRKDENTYVVTLDCTGWLVTVCDRCLDDLKLQVDTSYTLTVRQEGDELDDSADDVLLLPEAWGEWDTSMLIRDTVLLTIPIMHTHDPGACDPLMMERLNQHSIDRAPDQQPNPLDDDDSTGDNIDPRWEALRKLKENKANN